MNCPHGFDKNKNFCGPCEYDYPNEYMRILMDITEIKQKFSTMRGLWVNKDDPRADLLKPFGYWNK